MDIAIFALYQRHEFLQARCFIAQVRSILGTRCRLHILINDDDCGNLRAFASEASDYITVHWTGRNLGVAGGRNLLIRRAMEFGAEFLVSCDTDIIYEACYFERLIDAYRRLARTDPDIGFVQPILLDGQVAAREIASLQAADWKELGDRVLHGDGWRTDFWQALQARLGNDGALRAVHHAGVSNIWRAHFGDPPDSRMPRPWARTGWIDRYLTEHGVLRLAPQLLAKAIESRQPVPIASTAGGVTAFHANVIKSIGDYDDIFNPFGYEDSELGFRSVLAGHNNYLIPDAFAIHDMFLQPGHRPVLANARRGLLRGVELTHPAVSQEDLEYGLLQSLLFGWRELFKPYADEIAAGRMAGDDVAQQLPDFLLSYVVELLRGLLHGLTKISDGHSSSSLFGLLRGFLDGNAEIVGFELPLGLGGRMMAARAISRRHSNADGSSLYSFYASNCRVEEAAGEEALTSRHFDVSCVISPEGSESHRVVFDIQSDDQTFRVSLRLRLSSWVTPGQGVVLLEQSEVVRKHYDFGQFSTEDIYPEPTLHRSTVWLPMLQHVAGEVAGVLDVPGLRRVMDLLVGYFKLKPDVTAGTPSEIDRASAEGAITFAAANRLFADRRFNEALSAYVELASSSTDGPRFLYERGAVNAFVHARQSGLACRTRDLLFLQALISSAAALASGSINEAAVQRIET